MHLTAFAPGRVNLIGDHTDHTGGLVLPMAIDLGITIEGERGGERVELVSGIDPTPAVVPLGRGDPAASEPGWARLVAGVVAEVAPEVGFSGSITSTLPVGAGLASSAAFAVAMALALGADDDPIALARLAQRAERRSTGVPCGLMDQLVSVAGIEGAALLIDTGRATFRPVQLPPEAEVVVVHSGEQRVLADSAYADVRSRCVSEEPVAARHVRSENERVEAMADAFGRGDLEQAGSLMVESHRSLAELGVSTPTLDRLVSELLVRPGVWGARLTGAGFGGCVVALCASGAFRGPTGDPAGGAWTRWWRTRPSAGASVSSG